MVIVVQIGTPVETVSNVPAHTFVGHFYRLPGYEYFCPAISAGGAAFINGVKIKLEGAN